MQADRFRDPGQGDVAYTPALGRQYASGVEQVFYALEFRRG